MKANLPSFSRRGAVICGAHGMGNTGDDAALSGILADLRSIDPLMPIAVLSRSPGETSAVHGVESFHSFNIFRLWRRLKDCRLFISGGGSLIQDVTSTRSLLYYLLGLCLAKWRGCAVMMYGCGIGPVRRKINRRLCKKIINRYVDAVSLRDAHSLSELHALGVSGPEISLACDPAMWAAAAPEEETDALMERHGLDKNGRYICFCLRSWAGFGEKAPLFGRAADYARERHGLEPLFLALSFREDADASRLAAAGGVLIAEPLSPELAAGLISRMEVLVSMRLHALIFAAGQSVPMAGIGYDPKVDAFLRYIGQENYTGLEGLDQDKLLRLIDTAAEGLPAAFGKDADKMKPLKTRSRDTAARLLSRL